MSSIDRHTGPAASLAFALIAFALVGHAIPDRDAGSPVAFAPQSILADAATLASERFEGRGAGSAGLEAAGDYLAERLRQCGVAPAGDDHSYFQVFDVAAPRELTSGSMLTLRQGDVATSVAAGRDWRPASFSGSGAVRGRLVYTGGAIPAADAADLRSAVVLIRASRQGGHDAPTSLRLLATAARERGATAVVALVMPNDPGADVLPATNEWNAGNAVIPVVRLRYAAVADVLAAGGLPRATLDAADAGAPAAAVTHVDAEISVDLAERTARLRNVIGLVPGTGHDGALVLGAHYDHLGYATSDSLARDGERGAMHPGADDNASGVAVALAVACQVAATPLERPLLVALFAGEEIGLLGSAHYVEHPVIALEDTVAMVNLDMVGRLRRDRAVVFGSGSAREFPALLHRIAGATGLRLGWESDGIGPSDQTSFFLAQRPVLHFFTGAHADYHRPTDRAELLNAPGMAKIAAAVLATLRVLAADERRPTFVGATRPQREATGGYGAYLGTVPDFGRASGGVRLAAVRDGSPAELAGLRADDVIVGLGGVAINDLYDLTYALRSHVAGDAVTVEWLHAGRRQRADATLGARQ